MDSKRAITVPTTLQDQILQYRGHVRWQKITEAFAIGATASLSAFLALFLLDRWIDTPFPVRSALFVVVFLGVAQIPWAWHRWVVQLNTLHDVAKLLRRHQTAIGDSLVSVLELADNSAEQSRSPALCQAALRQVAESTAQKNLLLYLPPSQHLRWRRVTCLAILLVILASAVYPVAAWNAFQRLALPLSETERFTFTQFESVPKRLVVPMGEDFDFQLKLAAHTHWQPARGEVRVGAKASLESDLAERHYAFSVPGQLESTALHVSIGDASPRIDVLPAARPELEKLSAIIELPSYLQIDASVSKDVRGGVISAVRGSTFHFSSKTNKPLAAAFANNRPIELVESGFRFDCGDTADSQKIELRWTDNDGLESKQTFPLQIQIVEDEAPVVFADNLPKVKVVLDSEQLPFTVRAIDDFGVQHVGLEWNTLEENRADRQSGEWMLAKGTPAQSNLEAFATFQAEAMRVPSKSIELRLFAEDYFEHRGRVYSSPCVLHVLAPNEHAMWLLDQLTKWQRESLEVRDRELQLLATNKQLRELTMSELQTEENKKRLEQQASAELANGRRLNNLTAKGDDLLRQAARNAAFDPNQLESWAQMQQVLKDIASNRMPSVADLLKKSARSIGESSPKSPSAPNTKPSNQVGTDRSQPSEKSEEASSKDQESTPNAPAVVDNESTQQQHDESDPEKGKEKEKKSSTSPSKLSLPTTNLASSNSSQSNSEEQADAPENALQDAVRNQEDLLAEFQKVADKLGELMGNLEGSTLVKRLKAASREQLEIADGANQDVADAFGASLAKLTSEQRQRLEDLKQRETLAADFISMIVDDMAGFHERRPSGKLEEVLAEMKSEDLLSNLRGLSERILEHQGLAIAEAEYWSDSLDRWAEDLVDSAAASSGEGGKQSSQSLPPAMVLEVMQILEQEMNVRDRTRVAEQSKSASSQEQHLTLAQDLSQSQKQLWERVVKVREAIRELPNGVADFDREIGLLEAVDVVMLEAASILSTPNTGKEAIAAETEIIELLLKAKRSSAQKSGGGGGSDPGGGGTGTTDEAAIAMIGAGTNPDEQRQEREVSQETGVSGKSLPEEYRGGLDEYFQRLEKRRQP